MEPDGMLESIIVGAGQAGLATSYFLQQERCRHVVLERGRIGESWLSQRWDSFQLNTPNYMSVLPGLAYEGPEPDGFWRAHELVAYFRRYAERATLPVRTGVTVTSIEQSSENEHLVVRTKAEGGSQALACHSVVIASGMQQAPTYPAAHAKIPRDILQVHTADYRNPAMLSPGAVVLVGSGQSGVQIAEDLLAAGRRVYLCTSRVGRSRRRYRGRDSFEWSRDIGLHEQTLASLKNKSEARVTQSQISGVGRYGHTVSLQGLARQGAVILGRLLDVDGDHLLLSDEAAANVRFADEASQRRKDAIDRHLSHLGVELPFLEDDPADEPDPRAECASPLRSLDLREAEVGAIVWATGFTADFGWIRSPALDADGTPVHERGVSSVPGLYFVGFPWLSKRKSGFIYGVGEDAEYIAAGVMRHLGGMGRTEKQEPPGSRRSPG